MHFPSLVLRVQARVRFNCFLWLVSAELIPNPVANFFDFEFSVPQRSLPAFNTSIMHRRTSMKSMRWLYLFAMIFVAVTLFLSVGFMHLFYRLNKQQTAFGQLEQRFQLHRNQIADDYKSQMEELQSETMNLQNRIAILEYQMTATESMSLSLQAALKSVQLDVESLLHDNSRLNGQIDPTEDISI